ncbi:uncharacterized protein LOC124677005 [Lolium rigidum]|uniref:uncharacterized protein LOC124677005 n=1 Tax=Lolium rigidum TaxID=89674 RepID=UPI001F5C4E3E|nr:uncharacterized protein LOC124677005 [Lolium rigidum]
MGRGRGRGRKIIPNSRSHEDYKGSGSEEVAPARKRRGRPQKQKVDPAQVKNLVEGVLNGNADYQQVEGDDAKLEENGSKRNRVPQEEGSDHHDLEENSSSTTRSSNDESATRSSGGFRLNGSRRKSTPRRAAEAGL